MPDGEHGALRYAQREQRVLVIWLGEVWDGRIRAAKALGEIDVAGSQLHVLGGRLPREGTERLVCADARGRCEVVGRVGAGPRDRLENGLLTSRNCARLQQEGG